MDQFAIQKLAFHTTQDYFRKGFGVELATCNAVAELLAVAPWITPWEAGQAVDRAWLALEKQKDMATRMNEGKN